MLAAIAALEAGQVFDSRIVRIRHASGEWLHLRLRGSRHGNTSLLIATDLTVQNNIKAALIDSQTRLRSLYDAAPVAIILWGREGRITDWNRTAAETFGYIRDAVVGQKLMSLLVHPDDHGRFIESVSTATKQNVTSNVRCRTLTHIRNELLCEWHSTPLRNEGGALAGVLSLVHDITAQVAAEATLRQARDMAEELSQAKTEFMATISHELRTPLNGILGIAQLFQHILSGEEEQGLARSIEESGHRLLEIVNAIVEYTRIDLQNLSERSAEFSIGGTVTSSIESFRHRAKEKGLALSLEIDASCEASVIGDERSIITVVTNLVDNAIRFTETGYVRITVRKENCDYGDAMLVLDVADSGIGMTREYLEQHLFTPFKQAENVLVRKHGGMGMGLALTKKLIDRMGGNIHVESTEGNGSRFCVRIPLKPVQ